MQPGFEKATKMSANQNSPTLKLSVPGSYMIRVYEKRRVGEVFSHYHRFPQNLHERVQDQGEEKVLVKLNSVNFELSTSETRWKLAEFTQLQRDEPNRPTCTKRRLLAPVSRRSNLSNGI